MSEDAAPYGKQEPPFPERIETLRQRLDLSPNDASQDDEIRKYSCKTFEDLTWEIGRNEHAKHLLQRLILEITALHTDKMLDRLQEILSCLEKPRPND